jgi:GNAT superfamily N-acetyltransferase
LFVVTHEALAPGVDATVSLEKSGLAPALSLTGMVADRLKQASVPAGLSLVVPQDELGLGAFFDLNGAAYGEDLSACKPVHARPSFWAGHVGVVGSAEGRPVTCAAVLMAGGHRYVAMVATDPPMQRRGYAAAAMLYALDLAARAYGDRPSFLHATAAGRPIYARMGYDTVSTHTAYQEPGPGNAHSPG